MQKRAAECKPLQHAARVRADPCMSRVPEIEAFEQHSDPLAAFGNSIEASVQIEVLECGQLSIDERLVPEVPDPSTLDLDGELAGRRRGETDAKA